MKKYVYTFEVKVFATDDELKQASYFLNKVFKKDYMIGIDCVLGNITMRTGRPVLDKDLEATRKIIKKHFIDYFEERKPKDREWLFKIKVGPAQYEGTIEDETTVER